MTYSQITLTDETSGAVYTLPGTFSTGCLFPAGTRVKGGCI